MSVNEGIGIALGGMSLVLTGYNSLFRYAKVEARVELLWAFLLRQSTSEALQSGLLQRNSPLRLNINALRQHDDLVRKLQDFYATDGKKLSDVALFMELEKRFGDSIHRVSVQHGCVSSGAAAAAMFLLRPESPFFTDEEREAWERPC